jgi:hypothetical protein
MEHHHFSWGNPLFQWGIFYSQVPLRHSDPVIIQRWVMAERRLDFSSQVAIVFRGFTAKLTAKLTHIT